MAKPPAAESRTEQITRVAADLFNRQGFHETSMEDIAEAVGIKKPTLYHHVKSKAQIVSWIHDECQRVVGPPLAERMKSDLSASDILKGVATDILGLLEARPGYLRVYFEHHRDLDAASRSRITKKRDQYFANVRAVIERGNETGEFNVPEPALAALAFFGMCNWAYQWYQPGGPRSSQDIAETLWAVFVAGALAPGADRLP